MIEEKLIKEFCPTHGKTYCWRVDDKITCSVPYCDWTVPARRETDKQIPTSKKIKEDWR